MWKVHLDMAGEAMEVVAFLVRRLVSSSKMMDVVLHALNIVTYFLHVDLHPQFDPCGLPSMVEPHGDQGGHGPPQKF